MGKNFKVIENNDFDSSLTTEDYKLALRYHFGAGNLSRFEEERGRHADDKIMERMREFDNMILE